MKGFIKTWWHCLGKMFKEGHVMCWIRPTEKWCCECKLEEELKKLEE